MANARTLRELAASELPQQPLCITFPALAENTSFELKSGLIHLLPMFHGLSGLQTSDRSIIDAASGGALANKTPKEAWLLIESMAKNSQQFDFCESNPTRRVNEVEMSSIQQQISELTSFVRQLAVGNMHQAKACGICTYVGHPTDSCPMLQEDGVEQVNMARGVPASRRQCDPYSNTYNPDWRDHPNFSYGNRSQNSFSNRPPGFQQPWQQKPQPSSSNSGGSLEDIVKSLATSTTQFQQEIWSLATNTAQFQKETRSDMKNLETQISHMATAINRLESQVFGKLPSQPETNPKNVSAMALRSGKEVEGPKATNLKSKSEEEIEKEIEEEGRIRDPKIKFTPSAPIKSNLPPFPCKLEKTKK
ncbi:uncharacterized protein LOC113771601 [Coffea eugenioides]|uniref:uncharacterized protein LOC113771601 n=1 Tax=Coffea eugenioides TaxID=49369 RepID=UPI000F607F00|nr:uncharacterized protein LOC113771601 [Coffea eugenioides]